MQVFENAIFDDKDRKEQGKPTRKSYSHYTTDFQGHALSGDRKLGGLCFDIVKEIFGWDNKLIALVVYDHFKSNRNWMELGMVYRIDRFSSCFDPKWMNGQKDRAARQKVWADVWEALWNVIYEEREMFNDCLDGIRSIFLWLIARRYRLVSHFSTSGMFILPTICDSPRTASPYELSVTEVTTKHEAVKKCAMPLATIITLGFYATISFPETPADQTRKPSVSCFEITEEKAASKALFHMKTGLRGAIRLISSLRVETGRDFFNVRYLQRSDENVLQEIYDKMVQSWLGQSTPLSQDVIRPVYEYVQQLISATSNQPHHFNDCETLGARLSWYEVHVL